MDNTDSEDLVTTSSPYNPLPFPPDHRFHGLLRVPRVVDGKKDKQDVATLTANRATVKAMFIADLLPRVQAKTLSDLTAKDSAALATSLWQHLGIDMWQLNLFGACLWAYPNPKFTNSVLKALNQVINAHRQQEDKFTGILQKLSDKFVQLNPAWPADKVVYLGSGDIRTLFGMKTKDEQEEARTRAQALQAETHAAEHAQFHNQRGFWIPENALLGMRAAFGQHPAQFADEIQYLDRVLNSVEGEQEVSTTSNLPD